MSDSDSLITFPIPFSREASEGLLQCISVVLWGLLAFVEALTERPCALNSHRSRERLSSIGEVEDQRPWDIQSHSHSKGLPFTHGADFAFLHSSCIPARGADRNSACGMSQCMRLMLLRYCTQNLFVWP